MKNYDSQDESARLRAYYEALSEKELIGVASQYDSLSETAKEAIRAEFSRRHMPAPELADDRIPRFQSLVAIRFFREPPEAMIAKSVLESAGIFAFLRDENTVRLNWGYSHLIGGLRLEVRPEDVATAEEVLSQPIPPIIDANGVRYEQPRCPSCNSLDIGTLWVTSIRTCNTCGAKWEDLPDEYDNDR